MMTKKPEWNPIETAPKDGTDILVCFEFATVLIAHIAWYRSSEEWHTSGQHTGEWNSLEEWEGWWSYTQNSVSQEKLDGHMTPKYWMPLPDFPPGEGALASYPKGTKLRLTHSTTYFRVWDGQPEMLIEHGCDSGAVYIVGRAELEAVAEKLRGLLQES